MTAGGIDAGDVLAALPEVVVVIASGSVRWANPAARAWLGRDDLAGCALDEILASGERPRLDRLLAQRDAGWPMPGFRCGFVRRDGAALTAEVRVSQLASGETVLSGRDVTELTRAERLMGSLAALSSEPSLLGGPDALLDASAPVFEALGWTVAFTEITEGGSVTLRVASPPGSPVGEYGRSIVGVELPRERTPVLAEVLRRDGPIFLDNVPLLLQGPAASATALSRSMLEERVARSAWCPIRHGGRISHLLAVTGKDLTEHDFAAVQLFAAQLGAALRVAELSTELVRKERLAAVGEMAAVLAHEVRSPIGVMFNALGLIRRTGDDGERARLMDMLTEEAERLGQLVQDLLDFADPKTAALEAVDVGPLVKAALEALRLDPVRQEKAARVELAIGELPRPVRGSPMLLRRALINLLQNALRHVPPGGLVRISAEDRGARVRLRVFNEGPPIDQAVASRIFEPFFTTEARGTGLGLAIVRRIATELGGSVSLEPSERGVTFALDLAACEPVRPPADQGAPK